MWPRSVRYQSADHIVDIFDFPSAAQVKGGRGRWYTKLAELDMRASVHCPDCAAGVLE